MLLKCRGWDFIYPASQASVFGSLDFSLRGPGFNAVFDKGRLDAAMLEIMDTG